MNEKPVNDQPQTSGPWWRHGMMWLVVGGPVLVVVAALATAVIAIRGADLLVDDASMARAAAAGGADAPAISARNHAVTPAPDR